MRGPIQYQRQFILQVHCGINAFCFIVTLICILALRFSIGSDFTHYRSFITIYEF